MKGIMDPMTLLDSIMVEYVDRLRSVPAAVGEALRAWAFSREGCCDTSGVESTDRPYIRSPGQYAEELRSWAFPKEGLGCYDTFEVRPEFIEVEPTKREFALLMGREFSEKEITDTETLMSMCWYRHPSGIEMGYFWDGDGILVFYVPELVDEDYSGVLINTDCKKIGVWEFRENVI